MASSSTKRNVLFIVEGRGEDILLRKINELTKLDIEYDIHTVNTSLYELLCDEDLDENFDVIGLLKEKANAEVRLKLSTTKFEDIYLLLDYDIHHKKFDHNILRKLMALFRAASDMGKILISFPMLEAYRHLGVLPDDGFNNRTVPSKHSKGKKYKKIVGDFTEHDNIGSYYYELVKEMLKHHIVKYNGLINGEFKIPSSEDFFFLYDSNNALLIDYQKRLLVSKKQVSVFSMLLFYVIELNPKIFNTIK